MVRRSREQKTFGCLNGGVFVKVHHVKHRRSRPRVRGEPSVSSTLSLSSWDFTVYRYGGGQGSLLGQGNTTTRRLPYLSDLLMTLRTPQKEGNRTHNCGSREI